MAVRSRRRHHDRAENMLFGFALVGLGVMFLAHQTRWITMSWVTDNWGLLVVGLGILRILTARDAHRIGNGVSMALLGAWFWVATTNWMGLTWYNSWPLSLVAAGSGILARGMANMFLPDQYERDEEHDNV